MPIVDRLVRDLCGHGSGQQLAAAAQGLELLPARQVQAGGGEGVEAMVNDRSLWLGTRALAGHFLPSLGAGMAHEPQQWEADTLRHEARQVVERLQGRGIRIVMLSGDNRRTAEAVAARVGSAR